MEQIQYADFHGLPYLRRAPDGGIKAGKRYPTVIFFHGAGGRGKFDTLIENPFFKAKENPVFARAIVYAPCCMGQCWFDDLKTVRDFIAWAIAEETTDADRVSLVGASMGGYAVWQLAISDPDRYAAIIPVCGGGMAWCADRLVGIAIRAFHGEDDDVVPCIQSRQMTDAVKRLGGDAELTVYPRTKHNAWDPTYADREVFEWLLAQKRQGAAVAGSRMTDATKFG